MPWDINALSAINNLINIPGKIPYKPRMMDIFRVYGTNYLHRNYPWNDVTKGVPSLQFDIPPPELMEAWSPFWTPENGSNTCCGISRIPGDPVYTKGKETISKGIILSRFKSSYDTIIWPFRFPGIIVDIKKGSNWKSFLQTVVFDYVVSGKFICKIIVQMLNKGIELKKGMVAYQGNTIGESNYVYFEAASNYNYYDLKLAFGIKSQGMAEQRIAWDINEKVILSDKYPDKYLYSINQYWYFYYQNKLPIKPPEQGAPLIPTRSTKLFGAFEPVDISSFIYSVNIGWPIEVKNIRQIPNYSLDYYGYLIAERFSRLFLEIDTIFNKNQVYATDPNAKYNNLTFIVKECIGQGVFSNFPGPNNVAFVQACQALFLLSIDNQVDKMLQIALGYLLVAVSNQSQYDNMIDNLDNFVVGLIGLLIPGAYKTIQEWTSPISIKDLTQFYEKYHDMHTFAISSEHVLNMISLIINTLFLFIQRIITVNTVATTTPIAGMSNWEFYYPIGFCNNYIAGPQPNRKPEINKPALPTKAGEIISKEQSKREKDIDDFFSRLEKGKKPTIPEKEKLKTETKTKPVKSNSNKKYYVGGALVLLGTAGLIYWRNKDGN